MPLVDELPACEGGSRGREPEVGGAARIRSIKLAGVESKTASAHVVCLGW
jgi:hypothetical protein